MREGKRKKRDREETNRRKEGGRERAEIRKRRFWFTTGTRRDRERHERKQIEREGEKISKMKNI